jgi:hypothetical protein
VKLSVNSSLVCAHCVFHGAALLCADLLGDCVDLATSQLASLPLLLLLCLIFVMLAGDHNHHHR